VGVECIALSGEAKLSYFGHITPELARQFDNDLRRLPAALRVADCLDLGERYDYLDDVSNIARQEPANLRKVLDRIFGRDPTGLEFLTSVAAAGLIDWNVPLRAGNEWCDRMVAAMRQPILSEREYALVGLSEEQTATREAVAAMETDAMSLSSYDRDDLSQKAAELLIANVLSADILIAAQGQQEENDVRYELTRLALALAAYRADHGHYPARLADLVPTYRAELYEDPFTGNDLVYEPDAAGYLLYSVGPNRMDDGGRRYSDAKDDVEFEQLRDCDDIAIRMPPNAP